MIVHKIKLVYARNVRIHVRIPAALMPNAMSFHIQRSVIVCLAIEAMHLLDAHQFHANTMSSMHVSHRRAVKIHNVQHIMGWLNVAVFRHILAMPMALAADPNAFIIQIAPAEWLVFDNIAVIHVQVFVAQTLNVLSLIIFQFVLANETIKVMLSAAADQFHDCVSFSINFFLEFIIFVDLLLFRMDSGGKDLFYVFLKNSHNQRLNLLRFQLKFHKIHVNHHHVAQIAFVV